MYYCRKYAKMLIYFKVSNYKSIKEELTLNFMATSIGEHENSNIIKNDQTPLLKSILLYGPNASGKSKILEALVFFKWFVNNSAIEKQSTEKIDVEPFELNDASSKKPCSFEIAFLIGSKRYRYGFEADKKTIHREWLLESKSKKEYPVFLRINQEFEVDFKRFEHANDLENRTRKNALFLSVASQWNVQKAQQINDWFDKIFTVHGLADENYRDITINLMKSKKCIDLINLFMQKADLGINAVDLLPIKIEDVLKNIPEKYKDSVKQNFQGSHETAILTMHDKYNDKNEIIGKVPFLMDKSESEGTKKYFNMIGIFILALKEGRIVIIDEFDGRLHTLLTKAIIKIFNSARIQSNAQLIVASHDVALLDRKLLRRDQIYFVEKNRFGASKLTSLVEFKPRKETPYDKNYLDGKYGAIPFVEDLELLLSNDKTQTKKSCL